MARIVTDKVTVGDVACVCVHEQGASIQVGCVVVKVAGVNVASGVSQVEPSALLAPVEGELIQAELHTAVGHLISS